MAHAIKLDAIDQLPTAPAADVKKRGWRHLMKTVAECRRVVVTNHKQPEAVILSADEYRRLMQALAEARPQEPGTPIEELRRRFKARMAAQTPEAANAAYRAVMDSPAALDGQVRAGERY